MNRAAHHRRGRWLSRQSAWGFAVSMTAALLATACTPAPRTDAGNASTSRTYVSLKSATSVVPSTPSATATRATVSRVSPAAVTSKTAPTTAGSADGGSAVTSTRAPAPPSGRFTLALAGDFNFSERTAGLLADDPQTALQQAADQLSPADLTMVNLETAITERGSPAPKQFHFRAPASALDALAAGGVDVVTMANNHAVDYGDIGLADSLAAVADSPIPVIGIGATANAAYAPFVTDINGLTVAIFAASQVHDWTIASHTATDTKAGIASALAPRLVDEVRQAARAADVVIVYLHWGIEYQTCPSSEQRQLADQLANAGATAVVGTHAHVLQGAGWRDDGVYVAYGLGNYYWWRSFGNSQDDNGVLTLTVDRSGVIAADFLPTHLDARGVPLPAAGASKNRIDAAWDAARVCAGLAVDPP